MRIGQACTTKHLVHVEGPGNKMHQILIVGKLMIKGDSKTSFVNVLFNSHSSCGV